MSNTRRPPLWASVLTIVFGAIPATAIAVLPLMALVLGVAMLFGVDSPGDLIVVLLFTALGGGGIFGTVSLWWVGLVGRTGRWVTAGLVCGLLAIAPYTISALGGDGVTRILSPSLSRDWLGDVGLITAPAVALAWCLWLALYGAAGTEPDVPA